MKTLSLSLLIFWPACAQTVVTGKATIAGNTRMSEAQAPLVNVLPLTTQNGFAPSGSLLTGFPTVTGGVPAEGYQGGLYINGMALFTPHLYANSISQGTLLAYTGGSGGTFHCTTPAACAANYSWFDMTTLSPFCPSGYGTCPSQDSASGYTCGQVVDNNSVVYYIPGASQQFPVMMAFNALGNGGVTIRLITNTSRRPPRLPAVR